MFLTLALLAAGPAADEVQVAVLRQPVPRGQQLQIGDFTTEARNTATARGALAPEAAAGMEATRNLPAGTVVRQNDIARPQVVHRSEPVTVRIVQGQLVITAAGRALAGGAVGDPVRVVVNATNRTLDGVIEAGGTVRVTAP